MSDTSNNINEKPPKRPRTAYNYFFQDERAHLLDSLPSSLSSTRRGAHGKISFSDLGKTIAARWKQVDASQLAYYAELANRDKFRYLKEKQEYKQRQKGKITQQQQQQQQQKTLTTLHAPDAAAVYPETFKARQKKQLQKQISSSRASTTSTNNYCSLEPNDCSDLYGRGVVATSMKNACSKKSKTIPDAYLAHQLDQKSIDFLVAKFALKET